MDSSLRQAQCKHGSLSGAQKVIGVIGSRSLPVGKAELVGSVVDDLLKRKFHIASGGAVGV